MGELATTAALWGAWGVAEYERRKHRARLRDSALGIAPLNNVAAGMLHAAALAMAGYPALALAYFGEPGLPQCLCSIPLDYVARAIGWLRIQAAGRGRPVVLYGASAGAEAVLLLASYLPYLADGVAASSPTAVITPGNGLLPGPAWTLGGQPLTPGTAIPVTRIRIPLLMGDGGQDPRSAGGGMLSQRWP